MTTTLRASIVLTIAAAVVLIGGAQASADHAGETITVSQTSGLADGDTVKVTVAGFTPNAKPVKLVIAGQGKLVTIPDKLNFDEYASAPTVAIAADGTGSADFVVTSDHGTVQDGSMLDCTSAQCWIIAVQEPFLPQPNYASSEISFGDAPPPAPATTAVAAPESTVAPTTSAPPTTEAATTTTELDTDETAAPAEDDDDGGSALLWVIIAAAVVVIGAGAFFLTRRKPAAG